MTTVIQIENLWKEYRLGVIGHGTLTKDLQSWWARVRGKEDPNSRIPMLKGQEKQIEGDRFWALRGIDLEVKQGEILGIIGKNGAGKSTLLKILSRVTAPTRGDIKVKGRIASLLEVGTGFHPELTGRENIFMNGAILGMSRQEIRSKFDEIVDFSGVSDFIDTPVKRYSSGMYVRLAFAVAAHLEPEIMIVDEVLAVGDAEFQKKCLGKMEHIAAGGRTIIFVSHNMSSIQNLCNRALLCENGKVVETGPVDKVVAAYLENSDPGCVNFDAEKISDRSGSGMVRFTGLSIENSSGKTLKKVVIGEDIYLNFVIKVEDRICSEIDIGFSLHDPMNQTISVLYSSYQGMMFKNLSKGYYSIRCLLKEYNIALPKVLVKGRIVVDKEESDWPKLPIGRIDTVMVDFYGSGTVGFGGQQVCALKGEWECMNI